MLDPDAMCCWHECDQKAVVDEVEIGGCFAPVCLTHAEKGAALGYWRKHHTTEVKRIADLQVKAKCSCGSWLMLTAEPDGALVKVFSFNRLCVANDLVYKRFKGRQAAA